MDGIRAIREASGLCVQCGAVPDRLGMLCSKCNSKARESAKEYLKKRLALRMCRACNNPIDRPKGWLCRDCRKKASEREYERRKALKDKGLCVQCETPSNGYRLCSRCRDMKYEARARQKEKGMKV